MRSPGAATSSRAALGPPLPHAAAAFWVRRILNICPKYLTLPGARPCPICRPEDQASPVHVHGLWGRARPRKLAVLDGDPGAGKTFLALDLAARLARLGRSPTARPSRGSTPSAGLSAEDDAADTLCPRARCRRRRRRAVLITVPFWEAPNLLPDGIPALAQTVPVCELRRRRGHRSRGPDGRWSG